MNSALALHQDRLRILSVIVIIVGVIIVLYYFLFGSDSEVMIQWSTASEVETVGFNLYRSEVEEGPFEKITDELVPASSDPYVGSNYSYRDKDVEAGKTYFYQLEDVDKKGNITTHGPILVTAGRGNALVLVFAGLLVLMGVMGFIASLRIPTRGELN